MRLTALSPISDRFAARQRAVARTPWRHRLP